MREQEAERERERERERGKIDFLNAEENPFRAVGSTGII